MCSGDVPTAYRNSFIAPPRVDMAGLTGLAAPTLRSFASYLENSRAEAALEVRPQEFSGFDTGDFRISLGNIKSI